MSRSRPRGWTFAAGAVAGLALGGAALAQPQGGPPPVTAQLQDSAGEQAWKNNPVLHGFYDLSKSTLGKGAANVDVAAYEQKSYAIFRAFARSVGADPAGMQDHLKLIPRQVVKIVAEDPTTLDSYDSFWLAMVGPP